MVALLWLAFVGPETCRPCHPAQYSSQYASHHARALRPIGETPVGDLLREKALAERSGIEFGYAPEPAGLSVRIKRGQREISTLLEWAFGAGAQAVTPVGRYRGRWYEHRISWYEAPRQAARTIGHPADPSATPEQALGLPQSAETIFRCFHCHATGVREGPDLSAMRPGVTCERCHGPGSDHAAQPSRTNIRGLSRLPARESVQMCAECHRAPIAPSAAPEVNDPVSIRFQPVSLLASRCFQRSGALSCVTCHDPHQDARHDPSFYTPKCRACHSSAQATKRCPRAPDQDCVPCHMERRSPLPFLTFTDHRIRVLGARR
ncbi:MAG: hypothetical protein HY235_21635 [Acidobacteria bacterium]|nr:hypothetical protein [Acidobacteriota bacterium]